MPCAPLLAALAMMAPPVGAALRAAPAPAPRAALVPAPAGPPLAARALAAVASPTCATVSVHLLDAELRIAAVAVHAARPPSPKGSLICSYYGATGHAANQATIVYLRADAAQFAAIRRGVAATHRIAPVAHLGAGAFSYAVPPVHYLYLQRAGHLVEIYAQVATARLELLARRMLPLLA
ncbi:MAG TPA: hypothetical protein VMV02_04215 [Acidimicrobiales bacterium]|nr:hypothetical protein [Acidimicrobiales bacterium]